MTLFSADTEPSDTRKFYERVGREIRSNNRNAFKSGEWGRVMGFVQGPAGRPCYLIFWPNGDTDIWMVNEGQAGDHYEFR